MAKLPQGMSVKQAIHILKARGDVEYVEPNYTAQAQPTTPNDPSFTALWGLNNTGQTGGTADADIDAPEAWDLTTGGTAAVVAVLDTGVLYTHPDLVANMWTNPGEIPANGIDDDANGFIDDVFGIDTLNNDTNPIDDNGHGSHVSGTIGARGNNAVGVAGVNWVVKIMALKFLSAGGSGFFSGAIAALNYAVMMKTHPTNPVNVRVMNHSWGGSGFSQALMDASSTAGGVVTFTLKDQFGNPMAGRTLTFGTTASSLSASSGTTDASGQAQTTLSGTSVGVVSGSFGGFIITTPPTSGWAYQPTLTRITVFP